MVIFLAILWSQGVINEMMAQTAAALIAFLKNETFNKIVYLMNVRIQNLENPFFQMKRSWLM